MRDWLAFEVRWLHVITAIAWIGSSFYFVALDLGLRKVTPYHQTIRDNVIGRIVEELLPGEAQVERRLGVIPEFDIAMAPENSTFVVLTHDHALDFLLASTALKRGDATCRDCRACHGRSHRGTDL